MATFTLNPITGELDLIGMTPAEAAAYLKLDQTTPQTIENGLPIFEDGISIYNANWDIKPIDSETLGLYINGSLVQSWTISTTVVTTGNPIGLLLSLTYA